MSDLHHNDDEISLQAYALEFCSDAVVCLDSRGRITRWNPAAERLFGFQSAEVLGRSDDPLGIAPAVGSRSKSRAPLQIEQHRIVLKHRDGYPLDLQMTSLSIPAVPHAGACCVFRPLTPAEREAERHAVERETTLTSGPVGSKSVSQQDTKLDNFRPITVLVIDDNAHIQTLVRSILERNNIAVLTASDPPSALSLLQSTPKIVEIALVDFSLLEKHDPQLIHKLRGLNPLLKVILTSGYDLEDLRDDIDSLQVDAFLQKPFLPLTLLQSVLQSAQADIGDSC
ncbi:MAG: response regulator [Planctomycetales bacterium]